MKGAFKQHGRLAGLAVALAAVAFTAASPAGAYPEKVENACRADYYQFCPSYQVGTDSLRLCMESKSRELSHSCKQALIDAGYVDRRRLKRGY